MPGSSGSAAESVVRRFQIGQQRHEHRAGVLVGNRRDRGQVHLTDRQAQKRHLGGQAVCKQAVVPPRLPEFFARAQEQDDPQRVAAVGGLGVIAMDGTFEGFLPFGERALFKCRLDQRVVRVRFGGW